MQKLGSRSYPGFIGSEIQISQILSSSEIFGGYAGWQLTRYLGVRWGAVGAVFRAELDELLPSFPLAI